MQYSNEIHEGDPNYEWVTSIFYESTTLSTVGDVLVLQAVPFHNDGYRCNVCDFDPPMNPCTDFSSPIDVYDCEENLCSDYDYCATLLDLDLTQDP